MLVVDQFHDFLNIVVVGQAQIAQFQPVLNRMFCRSFDHDATCSEGFFSR
jgi:hypothetical protein